MRISNREDIWPYVDQTSFCMAELLSYIPDEMRIHADFHSDFRAQPWGNCEPLAPSKLPFINNRMYLLKSLGAQFALMQESYFSAKQFDAKEKLLFSKHLSWEWAICEGSSHLPCLKYLILDPLQVVGQSRDFSACWLDLPILACSRPSDPVLVALPKWPSRLHA